MVNLDDIVIDPEFRDFLPAVADLSRLRAKVELEGWTDEPITVWQHHNILLDGHNRVAIWKEREDDGPPVREMRFETREAAFHWVVNNQCARRNLTPEQQRYLLGRKYTAEKAIKGGTGANQYTAKELNPEGLDSAGEQRFKSTSHRIGAENGVSHYTVEESEKFADAVDSLDARGVIPKADILAGKVKAYPATIIKAAKAETPEQAKAVIEAGRKTGRPRTEPEAKPAFSLDSNRNITVAKKNYERLGILFGQVQAIADGIEAINLDAGMSVLRKGDAEEWIDAAKRTMSALKGLSQRLKTEADRVEPSEVQEAEGGVDHGGETQGRSQLSA